MNLSYLISEMAKVWHSLLVLFGSAADGMVDGATLFPPGQGLLVRSSKKDSEVTVRRYEVLYLCRRWQGSHAWQALGGGLDLNLPEQARFPGTFTYLRRIAWN
jgi:hypothetical protein